MTLSSIKRPILIFINVMQVHQLKGSPYEMTGYPFKITEKQSRAGQLSNQLNFSHTDMFDNFIPSNRLPLSTQVQQIIELNQG